MRDFGDYLTITFGLLMLTLSGACTFAVGIPIVFPTGPGEFEGAAMAPVVVICGGGPMAGGAALAAMGLAAFQDQAPARWARQALLWLVAGLAAFSTACFCIVLFEVMRIGQFGAAAFASGFGGASAWIMISAARAALRARRLRV